MRGLNRHNNRFIQKVDIYLHFIKIATAFAVFTRFGWAYTLLDYENALINICCKITHKDILTAKKGNKQ